MVLLQCTGIVVFDLALEQILVFSAFKLDQQKGATEILRHEDDRAFRGSNIPVFDERILWLRLI
jgi:hypothetical protein